MTAFQLQVADIRSRVQRQFGDEAQSQITNSDILAWINEAQLEIAQANDLMQAVISTNIVGGQLQYDLPTIFSASPYIKLVSVICLGRNLRNLSQKEWVDMLGDPSQNQVNGPPGYYNVWGNKLSLYPVPDSATTGGLIIYYSNPPDNLVNDSDVSPLPPIYHMRFVEYCLAKARQQDDDLQGYQAGMQEFASNLVKAKMNSEWREQDVYASISTSIEDYGQDSNNYFGWSVYG